MLLQSNQQCLFFFSEKWRPRGLCVSRIYTAKQWIYVYHAHFSGERKLYVKTGHIYKMTATILLIKLGEIVYAKGNPYWLLSKMINNEVFEKGNPYWFLSKIIKNKVFEKSNSYWFLSKMIKKWRFWKGKFYWFWSKKERGSSIVTIRIIYRTIVSNFSIPSIYVLIT